MSLPGTVPVSVLTIFVRAYTAGAAAATTTKAAFENLPVLLQLDANTLEHLWQTSSGGGGGWKEIWTLGMFSSFLDVSEHFWKILDVFGRFGALV